MVITRTWLTIGRVLLISSALVVAGAIPPLVAGPATLPRIVAAAGLVAFGLLWVWFWWAGVDSPSPAAAPAGVLALVVVLGVLTYLAPPGRDGLLFAALAAGAALPVRRAAAAVGAIALLAGAVQLAHGSTPLTAFGSAVNDLVVGVAAIGGRLLLVTNRELVRARDEIAGRAVDRPGPRHGLRRQPHPARHRDHSAGRGRGADPDRIAGLPAHRGGGVPRLRPGAARAPVPAGGGGGALVAVLLAVPRAHAGFQPSKVLFYFLVGVVFGAIAYLTDSVLPAIPVHIAGDLLFFTLIWPNDAGRALVWTHGADAAFWLSAAQTLVFGGLAVLAFRRLRSAGHREARPPAGEASPPARSGIMGERCA